MTNWTSFDAHPPYERTTLLSVLVLLLYGASYWYVSIPISILCLSGILFDRLRLNGYFWFAIACFLLCGIGNNWQTDDNHKYLICYWTLALCICLFQKDDYQVLARVARLLVGLTFAFATLWKLISPDFLNGDFFLHCFFYDSRFSVRLVSLGIIGDAPISQASQALKHLTHIGSDVGSIGLPDISHIRPLAIALAYWTVLIEGLIAVSFLCSPLTSLSRFRFVFLWIFIVSTYAFAPVIGFGWILLVLAYASCQPDEQAFKKLFIYTFLFLQCFRLPWPYFDIF